MQLKPAARVAPEPAGIPLTLQLLDTRGAPVSAPAERVRLGLDLGPREGRDLQLRARIDQDVPAGRSVVIEARLFDRMELPRLVGSLGVALLPAERRQVAHLCCGLIQIGCRIPASYL